MRMKMPSINLHLQTSFEAWVGVEARIQAINRSSSKASTSLVCIARDSPINDGKQFTAVQPHCSSSFIHQQCKIALTHITISRTRIPLWRNSWKFSQSFFRVTISRTEEDLGNSKEDLLDIVRTSCAAANFTNLCVLREQYSFRCQHQFLQGNPDEKPGADI